MPRFSRRGFTGFLLAPLFRLRGQSTAAAAPIPRPARGERGDGPSRVTSRTYRADAMILLLGIAVYRRPGVGGGHASLEEAGDGASLRRTLFFAAGSDPQRAHGLSQLGWIREVVLGPASTPSESAYFGVLTASPEESLERARKSVDTTQSSSSIFNAVSGRNTAGRSRSAVTHFEFAAAANWADRSLIDHAQSTFHEKVNWRETAWPKSAGSAAAHVSSSVVDSLETAQEARRGPVCLQRAGVPARTRHAAGGRRSRAPACRSVARSATCGTGHETPFRLWLADGTDSIVPVRIEFQARSFLRLTFEAVPA